MINLPHDRMQQLVKRFEFIEAQMSSGVDPDEYVKLAAEYSSLEDVVKAVRAHEAVLTEIDDLEVLTADPETDPELKQMGQAELEELKAKSASQMEQLQVLLLPRDAADDKSVIIEIRAGTGGSEAAIFAGDLFRMYERYASSRGWKVNIDTASDGDAGGYKEIIAAITGRGAFARFKFESGTHRVQRVPETEASGRIHTSAATVAVLPEVEEVDIEIRNEDIRIDTMRASGAGGQHVNTTDSAVRITHEPTGIVVVQAEKSQHQNRARAMEILRARLYDLQRQQADAERSADRKAQVGSGDRSERIRTYNFPQGRVTDHRINLTLYKLDRIIEGDLDEVIDALVADFQAAQLAELGQEG